MIEVFDAVSRPFSNIEMRNLLIWATILAICWAILIISAIIDEIKYQRYLQEKRNRRLKNEHSKTNIRTSKTN